MRYGRNSDWLRQGTCRTRVPSLLIGMRAWKSFLWDESGQDLIEYTLVAVLIALGATAGMSGVAAAVGNVFNHVGAKIGSYTT